MKSAVMQREAAMAYKKAARPAGPTVREPRMSESQEMREGMQRTGQEPDKADPVWLMAAVLPVQERVDRDLPLGGAAERSLMPLETRIEKEQDRGQPLMVCLWMPRHWQEAVRRSQARLGRWAVSPDPQEKLCPEKGLTIQGRRLLPARILLRASEA